MFSNAAMPVQRLSNGAVVGETTLPELEAKAGVDNRVDLSSLVTVPSLDAFSAFGAALLNSDSVTLTLLGQATVTASIGGTRVTLPSVRFEKAVTMAGCGGLRTTRVLDFSLAGSTPTAVNAALTVAVFNPSVAAIAPLGDLAAQVFFEGTPMGQSESTMGGERRRSSSRAPPWARVSR